MRYAWVRYKVRHHQSTLTNHPWNPWTYDVTYVTLETRLPLLTRATLEKIGEPGDEATKCLRGAHGRLLIVQQERMDSRREVK